MGRVVNAARWTFHLFSGETVTGPVHGAGGVIGARDGERRLWIAIQRARDGRPTGLYEPKPGHARVYPEYSAQSQGVPVDVDLRTVFELEPK